MRIHATKSEGLKGGSYTQVAHFAGQPLGRCVVDFRPRPVISLGIVRLNHGRQTLLESFWAHLRLLECGRPLRSRSAGGYCEHDRPTAVCKECSTIHHVPPREQRACWLRRYIQAASYAVRTCFFVALSGHELGYLGMDAYLKSRADLIKRARAWIFFGSSIGEPRQPNLIHASDDALE